MTKNIEHFLTRLKSDSQSIDFNEVIAVIDANYTFSPTAFKNGTLHNDVGQNSGSCKVFSFAILHDLSKEVTLCLFAQYYQDVKATPEGDDHQNIRQFMLHGIAGLTFEGKALKV